MPLKRKRVTRTCTQSSVDTHTHTQSNIAYTHMYKWIENIATGATSLGHVPNDPRLPRKG